MWRERKNVDCRVEVPQVQIIDEIVQAPFKKEVRPQEEFGDCPVEVRSATKEAVYYYSIGFDASGSQGGHTECYNGAAGPLHTHGSFGVHNILAGGSHYCTTLLLSYNERVEACR